MSEPALGIRGNRVLVGGEVRPAVLRIAGGRIAEVLPPGSAPGDGACVDAGDRLVTPGLVDAHVHVNEPGRTEWEGYATATAAAAAGGVTTLVDMPLNGLPPTLDAGAVALRRAAIEGVARVDVALWGGLVPGSEGALDSLAAAGVAGFKCFLCPSGVEEFPPVSAEDLDRALPVLRALGLPLLAHAESPAVLARHANPQGGTLDYEGYLATRPPSAEAEAVALLVGLARRHGARVHVVHVSCRESIGIIAGARADGIAISAETCPHYLTFAAGDIAPGATEYKCAPPIRDAGHREALWSALAEGTLDLVATDHSPCPAGLKHSGSGFAGAWGGIASLQFLLPALWTGARARGHGIREVMRWAAAAPARLAGIADRKGAISPGLDADLVVWDDAGESTIRPESVLHRHPLTPYTGMRLRGVVHQTWVRGTLAYDRERGLAEFPGGRWLPAGARQPDPPRTRQET